MSRWIREHAAERPRETAVVTGRRGSGGRTRFQATFSELEHLTSRTAAGLIELGLARGDRVVVMVEPGVAFFALAFALFRIGAVMVAIDPGMGIRRVGAALAGCGAVAFAGNPKAQLARALFGWGGRTVRTVVTVGSGSAHAALRAAARARGVVPDVPGETFAALIERGKRAPPPAPEVLTDDTPAAVLFTSGSTGPPKGVLYTHGIFEAQLAALRRAYDLRPGERELATFPLFALFAPALGMRAVIPTMDFTRPADADPEHLLALIEREAVTSMFGSPALIARLAAHARPRDRRLVSLVRVVSAGAPVPAATLERFAAALPAGAMLHTPYGATEALPVASIEAREILNDTRRVTETGGGVCIGRPCPGIDVRIVRITDHHLAPESLDRPLPVGEVGEIVVRGAVVTRSYVGAETAERLAKVRTARGWYHRMGDLGYLDRAGRLWFCGRKSERVGRSTGDLYTVACEAIFNCHPAVARSALVGVAGPGGIEPVVVVELHPRRGWETPYERRTLRDELTALARAHAVTRDIARFLFHPRFPVDPRHNAKIGREALARWAAGRPQ